MQKHVNLVDLVKSFPTNIFLQDLTSIQKSTSPVKFAHLAEKSEKRSISNLSTKAGGPGASPMGAGEHFQQHHCWFPITELDMPNPTTGEWGDLWGVRV